MTQDPVSGADGVLVLTADGRPLLADEGAQAQLKGGQLRWLEEARLRQPLGQIAGGMPAAALYLGGKQGRVVLLNRLAPVAVPASLVGWENLVLARIVQTRMRLPSRETLTTVFAMSEAEADVALLMAQGTTARQAAMRRGVSVATIRSQVQSALQKAGVINQKEMISLLTSVA